MLNNNENLELNPKPYMRFAFITIVIMFVIFFVWGGYAPLKSAAVASGKLIVSGQNKVVQHLYGGVVDEILVKNGDSVKKDQIVLTLDDLQAKSNYMVLLNNKYELIAEISRLESIINGKKKILFDDSLKNIKDKKFQEKLYGSHISIFDVQKKLLLTQDAIIIKKIDSLKDEIKGTKESLLSKNSYLESINEEISEWKELYRQKLVSKVNLRELTRKKFSLESELTNSKTIISKQQIQVLELQEQSLLQKMEFLNKIVSQLSDTRAELSKVEENL
ncbi:MAG: hypothetical protein U9N49_03985, partial [Campylobacterota bacterium]|nr:hypothetical protein [Campylobacterota bacterium]